MAAGLVGRDRDAVGLVQVTACLNPSSSVSFASWISWAVIAVVRSGAPRAAPRRRGARSSPGCSRTPCARRSRSWSSSRSSWWVLRSRKKSICSRRPDFVGRSKYSRRSNRPDAAAGRAGRPGSSRRSARCCCRSAWRRGSTLRRRKPFTHSIIRALVRAPNGGWSNDCIWTARSPSRARGADEARGDPAEARRVGARVHPAAFAADRVDLLDEPDRAPSLRRACAGAGRTTGSSSSSRRTTSTGTPARR